LFLLWNLFIIPTALTGISGFAYIGFLIVIAYGFFAIRRSLHVKYILTERALYEIPRQKGWTQQLDRVALLSIISPDHLFAHRYGPGSRNFLFDGIHLVDLPDRLEIERLIRESLMPPVSSESHKCATENAN